MKQLDELLTERLLLECLRAAHAADLSRLHRDERAMATLGGVRPPAETRRVLAECERHWEQYGFGLWAVRERATGAFVGRGGLQHTHVGDRDEVEVAYAFLPQYWGQGLATELATASVRVGFEVLQRPELVCVTLTTNHASQRVMEKAGFRYERNVLHAGLPHVLYRLTARAWRAQEI
ncbi:MAG TPA: GNAT family N-acetyltransferase [Candidatus Margulisiibacteriota bacterium]|nr:GNAT family N-acetyltransferase [Candidatus Margulisiibacteriota bacterium]